MYIQFRGFISIFHLPLTINLILNFKQRIIWQSRGHPLDRGTGASSSKYFVKYKFIRFVDLIFDIRLCFLFQMSEGLFNFVIGWTFMFAPLLFSDRKRDRFKGSLDLLWGFQMFLTNSMHFSQILTFDCATLWMLVSSIPMELLVSVLSKNRMANGIRLLMIS